MGAPDTGVHASPQPAVRHQRSTGPQEIPISFLVRNVVLVATKNKSVTRYVIVFDANPVTDAHVADVLLCNDYIVSVIEPYPHPI